MWARSRRDDPQAVLQGQPVVLPSEPTVLRDEPERVRDEPEVLQGRVITPDDDRQLPGDRLTVADEADFDLVGGLALLAERALGWARDRSITASSTAGISLTLAGCAAAWFSAGTRSGNVYGALMLCASYLCTLITRKLVGAQAGWLPITTARPKRPPIAWSYLPVPVEWLARMLVRCCDCVVIAGLAAGAAADRWSGMWPLAVAVLALLTVRQLMASCASPAQHDRDGPVSQLIARAMNMSAGGRLLLVALAAPAFGARAALLGLLGWAIIAIGYAIADELFQPPAEPVTAAAAGGSGGSSSQASEVPAAIGGAEQQQEPTGIDLLLAMAKPEHGQAGPAEAVASGSAQLAVYDRQAAKVRWCRDDGAIAVRIGAVVHGNVSPLAPALLGLAGAGLLAMLGLRDLPGILLLTPAIAMLMAAPGASHPHNGRADWLVPAVLLGAQCLYLATIGVAAGVPGGVSFVLAAAIVLRYTDLYGAAQPPVPPRGRLRFARAGLGWEGRMLVVGLGAALGIATWADLLLAGYLLWVTASDARSPQHVGEGW